MKNHRIELADVVRRFKDDYIARFGHLMMPSQAKALADLAGKDTGLPLLPGLMVISTCHKG